MLRDPALAFLKTGLLIAGAKRSALQRPCPSLRIESK
jgi:hypothetical protein